MKHGPSLPAVITLLAAFLAGGPSAAAPFDANYDKVRSDRWRCRLCPFETASRREGSWRVGAVSVEDAEPRFGRDNGLDEDGTRVDARVAYGQRGDDGRTVTVRGDDLGLDARDVAVEYRDGVGGVALRWREIPRNVATDGRTPYMGRTDLALPAGWVPALDTAGMTGLSGAATAFDHATQRQRASVAAHFRPRPRWRVDTDYLRETRKGTGETHADFLYQTAGLPKPIDYRTEALGGQLRFEAGTFLLGVGVRESRFENGDRHLEWENAYSGHPATGRKGLAPDSDARTLSLVSRWTRGRTAVSGSLVRGRHRQDVPFLPYTTNVGVLVDPLPADGLRGRASILAGSLAVVSRPTDRLRVSLKHRRRERDNDTRTLLLMPVLGDLFATAPRRSRAYGFERVSTELRLQYRLSRRLRLGAGSERSRVRRAPAEIARNDSRRSWIELLATDLRGFRLALRFADGSRDASAFRDVTVNNARMRRFHQAARDQRTWTAEFDYQFPGVGLSVGLDADYRRHDYPDSALGLQRDEDRGWGADFTYAPRRGVALSAFRAVRETDARTAGSSVFGPADWWYGTRDTVDTDGLTLELRDLLREGLSLTITYSRSEGRGRYGTERAGIESGFPDLLSEHRAVDVRTRLPMTRRTVLVLRYYLEDHGAADWAVDGVGLSAARNVLSFGRDMPDYGNGLFSVSVETRL